MNYLLYGEEDFLIRQAIDKILSDNNIDDISVNRYDLEISNLKDIIEDCETMSLFSTKKAIIINNCNYFNRLKSKEEDVNILFAYISNPNPNTFLIIINHNATIDNTKKITKKMKEKGHIEEFNTTNITVMVKKLLANYHMSDANVELFINRVGADIDILAEEINKIKIYKGDDLEITKDDILACSINTIDMDIFQFIDNIIGKKKEEALKTYYELIKNNEEPIKIIALLASKFRLMYQASILSKKGLNNNEIANVLGVHAYPVKLALQAGRRYSEKVLLRFLKLLADLDCDIKTGKVNAQLGLELFILKV